MQSGLSGEGQRTKQGCTFRRRYSEWLHLISVISHVADLACLCFLDLLNCNNGKNLVSS